MQTLYTEQDVREMTQLAVMRVMHAGELSQVEISKVIRPDTVGLSDYELIVEDLPDERQRITLEPKRPSFMPESAWAELSLSAKRAVLNI